MKDFNQEEFGKRFLALRESQGLTGRGFCRKYATEEIILNPEDWGNLEKGERCLTLDTLVKYCIHFDLSPLYLLAGIGPQSLKETERILNSEAEDDQSLREAVDAINDKASRRSTHKEAKGKVRRRAGQA